MVPMKSPQENRYHRNQTTAETVKRAPWPLNRRWNALRWTGGSARRATAIIGGAVIVLLAMLTIAASWIMHDRALEDWRKNLENLSLVLAENTAQTMASAYLVPDGLTETIARAKIYDQEGLLKVFQNQQTQQLMNDKISGLPQIDVATIVDANGDVVTFTRVYPSPPINLADRDYFEHLRSNASTAVFPSKPVRNKSNGKWTLYQSPPEQTRRHVSGHGSGWNIVRFLRQFLQERQPWRARIHHTVPARLHFAGALAWGRKHDGYQKPYGHDLPDHGAGKRA